MADPKIQEKLARLRAKMAATDVGGGTGFWSPPQGSSLIRILPELTEAEGGGMEFFYQEVGQHYIPGSKDKKEAIYCPSYTTNGLHPCPICELVSELWKGDDADKELARQIRHDRKFWMNVVVRGKDDKGGDTGSGPFIFTPGVTIFNAIQALVNSPGLEYEITDPDYGLDLEIQKKGEKLNTEYQLFPRMARKDIPLHADDVKFNEFLDKRQDLMWVMLTLNKEEDSEVAGKRIIRLKPYDRMMAEYGIGPGMDVSKLDTPAPQNASPARHAARHGEEEALATPRSEDAVSAEFARLRASRRPSA